MESIMRRMSLTLSVVIVLATTAAVHVAYARPQYAAAMSKTYSLGANGRKVSCRVCHPSRSKRVRNHYATALSEALENRNERDEDVIVGALKKIEDGR